MIHTEIQEKLEAYHDHQLNEADRRLVEVHLGACVDCDESLRRITSISRAVFRPVSPPPTDFFVSRVMARVSEAERESSLGVFQRFWQWTAFALTALAAFLILNSPADNGAASSRVLSTRNVLMAGSGATYASADRSNEAMDSLLDLSEEI